MHIHVEGLVKRYSTFALAVPSLTVAPGERVGLIGDYGAGKTTLMRALLGIVALDSGTVALDGAPPDEARAYIGAYLDERFLVDFLNASEFFAFVAQASAWTTRCATQLSRPTSTSSPTTC